MHLELLQLFLSLCIDKLFQMMLLLTSSPMLPDYLFPFVRVVAEKESGEVSIDWCSDTLAL